MGVFIEEKIIDKGLNPLFSRFEREISMEETIKKFDFNWELIEVIIGGKSSIDLSSLAIKTFEDAHIFIKTYGYDLNKDNIRAEAKHIFDEAISFLENVLIPDPVDKVSYLKIPEEIKQERDIRNLILIASEKGHINQSWACAVLRMMHTISHVNNDISLKFFPEIQRQILDKIWSAIYINSKGEKFFGDSEEDGIRIYDIDIKAKKERNSTILKLLHKVENVAADVFDQIGVRIITYDKLDTLLVIKQLKKMGVLNFCNVKPSRSINRLIDTNLLSQIVSDSVELLKSGELSSEEFENTIRLAAENEASLTIDHSDALNPHSNKEYRSLQFTARQMVRIKYPVDSNNEDLFSFFFPYEMQVVDVETHLENRFGKGSYDKYKEKQLLTARTRVLGILLKNLEKVQLEVVE